MARTELRFRWVDLWSSLATLTVYLGSRPTDTYVPGVRGAASELRAGGRACWSSILLQLRLARATPLASPARQPQSGHQLEWMHGEGSFPTLSWRCPCSLIHWPRLRACVILHTSLTSYDSPNRERGLAARNIPPPLTTFVLRSCGGVSEMYLAARKHDCHVRDMGLQC